MSQNNDADDVLERALAEIREEPVDASVVKNAGDRVWKRLSQEMTTGTTGSGPVAVERIRSCADVQALVPDYLRGSLSEARALLVQDHTRECVACRKALIAARSGAAGPREAARTSPLGRPSTLRWAIAASLLLAAGLTGFAFYRYGPVDPALSAVRVQAVDGALYRVAGNLSTSVARDEEIPGGETFRTAKGSRAVVTLADGSRVEMNERSELKVSSRRAGTTLHLSRGSIIVEAAKQRTKHLYVATNDCSVAVTGTVFSVNHGTKGSRVSVIEGEVHVRHSGSDSVLRPGDQISTSVALERVPVASEIAWSRNVDQHAALLAELTKIRREIETAVGQVQVRHATRLLDLAPEGTALYAAVPNLSGTLGAAHRILRERMEENPIVQRWWEERMAPAGADDRLDRAIEEIRTFGDQLKDELVVTVHTGQDGKFDGVLLMAELARPAEFRPFLEDKLRALAAQTQGDTHVRLVDDPSAAAARSPEELLLWVEGDVLAASTSLARLRELQATLQGRPNAFVTSEFRGDIARSYAEGTSWLLGVDMKHVLTAAVREDGQGQKEENLRRAGLLDARNLIVEGKETDGNTTYRGVLAFDQERRGVASWLAAPAPMGSLEFISPNAVLAAAFIVKTPVALAQDVFDMLGAGDPSFRAQLAEFEAQHHVDVLRDLAQPLGGEFAFALDGPLLPKPAWKIVAEIYDPAGFQHTVEWAVGELNGVATPDGSGLAIALEQETAGDRTYYTLRSSRLPAAEIHYTFVDGYLVAAPSRALVDAAIAYRASGTNLPASSRFTALLPQDGNVNFSAVMYQNMGSVLGPLAGMLGAAQEGGDAQQRQAIANAIGQTPATLAYAYGERDRIVVASTRPGGMFGPELDVLLGLSGLADMQSSLERSLQNVQAP